MITFKQTGNFNNTEKFLKRAVISDYVSILEKYARLGVDALASATPKDSGDTAASWDYKITKHKNGIYIMWTNNNIIDGVPVAVLIQYGHATRNGGYIQGRDFINPTIRPIFDNMTEDIWKEVNKL